MSEMDPGITIRPTTGDDREFVRAEMIRHWVSTRIVSRGVAYADAHELPGFVALRGAGLVGHVTTAFAEHGAPAGSCEIVTLAASIDGIGIGTRLLDAAIASARGLGCDRAFLTTSNDNLRALAFYQKRGWRLVRVWPGMIDRYRDAEPAIPRVGLNGIPLRDEIELEITLARDAAG